MRKKKSILNIITALLSYFSTMIFTFITQALIIKILGIEYSGVNGLFTNILTMLSVAELGLSTTIIYKLYEPIANNNKNEITKWLNFYKICYRYVALFVLIIGLLIIPFVPSIIGENSIKDNIVVLYIIALLDTVFSYVMTYKRSILYADQKNYIINIIHICYVIFMNITQIALLFYTRNYVIFLIIKLIYRLLENVLINLYVDKYYSFINKTSERISSFEKNDFLKRIRAMFVQKVSFVINKGIDNIIISTYLGITAVGYYTNYNLIATTLCGIIFQIISGLSASVGNLLTEHNKEKNYYIYKNINYINSFLTGVSIVGFYSCIKNFIIVWLGNDYILGLSVVISFCIYIYSDSIRRSITIFKEAAGICKEDQIMYIIMALLNLITSLVLGKLIGIPGVVIGTAISYLFLIFYSYPKYVFTKIFDINISNYYKQTVKYIIFIIISILVTNLIIKNIVINNSIISLIINATVSILITTIIFIVTSLKTNEFKYYKSLIIKVLKKEK